MGHITRQTKPDKDGIGYAMRESYNTGGKSLHVSIWQTGPDSDSEIILHSWINPDEDNWYVIEQTWRTIVESAARRSRARDTTIGTTTTILEEARELVYGDRNKQYGHPKDDYERTAKMWSAFLGYEITASQAASMMILVKMSRLAHMVKRDTVVDIAGYAEVVARIEGLDD